MATTPQQESERAGSGFASTLYGRPGNKSVRRLLLPVTPEFAWEDRQDKVSEILGYTTYGVEKQFKRFLPWFDPEDIQMPAVRCETRGISYDGQADSSGAGGWPMVTANAYKDIEFVIYFESVRQSFGTFENIDDPDEPQLGADPVFEQDRYTVKRIRPGREYISAKNGNFLWSDATGLAPDTSRPAIPFPIPEILPYQEIDVTWMDIPLEAYPITAIANCLGKVNSNEMPLPGPGDATYVAETLLLQAVSEEESFFPNGDLAFNLTYHFKYRNNVSSVGATPKKGWNVYPRPDGTFRPVFRSGTTSGVFLTEDYQTLFVPEP